MELAIELCNPISSVRHAAHLSIKHSPRRSLSVAGVVWWSCWPLFAVGICHRPIVYSRHWTSLFFETSMVLFSADVACWSYIVLCCRHIYSHPGKINFKSSDTVNLPSNSNQPAFDAWIMIFVSIVVECKRLQITRIF